MTEYHITDKEVNYIIDELLDWPHDKRLDSRGAWAYMFDKAMTQWNEMHPCTRPPCYSKVGLPPSCNGIFLPRCKYLHDFGISFSMYCPTP